MAVALDRVVLVLDVQARKQIAAGANHADTVSALAFSPDGRILASGARDRGVSIWDASTLKQIRRFSVPAPASALRFSPDGQRIIVTTLERTQREFDLATGQEVRPTTETQLPAK